MISRSDGLGADLSHVYYFSPIFTFRLKKTKVEISRRSGLHWLNELTKHEIAEPCLFFDR